MKITSSKPRFSNQHPLSKENGAIISVGLDPIHIKKLAKPVTSTELIDRAIAQGMDIKVTELRIFNEGKSGKERLLSNEDLVRGYPGYFRPFGKTEDIASAVANVSGTLKSISKYSETFLDMCKRHSQWLYDSEWEDMRKIQILRPQAPGRSAVVPLSPDLDTSKPIPPGLLKMFQRVARHYKRKQVYQKKGATAILDGTDAKDTAVGSPTFSADPIAYDALRMATLEACPPPDYSKHPSHYLQEVLQWGSNYFSDPSIILGSYLSYRQGATDKYFPLWYPSGVHWQADYEAKNVYTRQRAVWPAPFWLNVVITPLVLAMKSSRQHILGMWHTPEFMAAYIPKLQKQGSVSYEIDYSAYDTTISSAMLVSAYSTLADVGISPWEASLMAGLHPIAPAIIPVSPSEPGSVYTCSGQVTLLSGLLTTSEIGSFVSISLVLWGLESVDKKLVDKWFDDKFVILVQGDDVLFTVPQELDQKDFVAKLASAGIQAKMQRGNTFLKRWLPLGDISKMTRPFARNIQQTIGNEDDYSGKPEAILRMGFVSRSQSLEYHPLFKQAWPELMEIYKRHLSYFDTPQVDEWVQGRWTLSKADLVAITQYGESAHGSNFMTAIIERAKYDPSAAHLLRFLQVNGLSLDSIRESQAAARKAYTQSLFKPSTPAAINQLRQLARWS